MAQDTTQSQLSLEKIIEIRDPEIDVTAIMQRIRETMSRRKEQGLSLQTLVLSEERLALRAAYEKLKVRVHTYGTIGEPQPGLKGKIQFFMKRVVLKLIRRHVDQERDVQEALLKLVEQLIPYLDQSQYAAECLRRVERLEKTLSQGTFQNP
jgi:hypothetical protein